MNQTPSGAATAIDSDLQPITFEVGGDGLPTVAGYRQLYASALAQLEVDEPTWSRKRRERCASGMAEAYCHGMLSRATRQRA